MISLKRHDEIANSSDNVTVVRATGRLSLAVSKDKFGDNLVVVGMCNPSNVLISVIGLYARHLRIQSEQVEPLLISPQLQQADTVINTANNVK